MNITPDAPTQKRPSTKSSAAWKSVVAEHQKPDFWRATWQIVNTLGSYVTLWVLMYFSLKVSWWLTAPLAVLAGGLMVRAFIIFHDCGHGSYFRSDRANSFWGFVTGLLTFTPFSHWKWEHSVHHASAGHLDRRGVGDIWTMTVEEYLNASRWKQFSYRLARNPVVLFVIAPLYVFLIQHRFPLPNAKRQARNSVWIMNAALVVMVSALIAIYGWLPYLIIQLIILAVAGSSGIWLFYVQHQFEDAYWERGDEWDYTDAALKGSSFYKLPRVLQWFTGNIGFHHIHHLSPRIPNYNLERCHRSHPMFQEVKPVTLWGSMKSLQYRLWDEAAAKLISFNELRKLIRTRAAELSTRVRGKGSSSPAGE